MVIDEIHNQIVQDESEEVWEPRKRMLELPINHKNQVGEIVYSFLGKRKFPVLYIKANDFVSVNLQAKYQWWNIEYRLKSIFNWAKQKNVYPMSVVKVLNKEIAKLQ